MSEHKFFLIIKPGAKKAIGAAAINVIERSLHHAEVCGWVRERKPPQTLPKSNQTTILIAEVCSCGGRVTLSTRKDSGVKVKHPGEVLLSRALVLDDRKWVLAKDESEP